MGVLLNILLLLRCYVFFVGTSMIRFTDVSVLLKTNYKHLAFCTTKFFEQNSYDVWSLQGHRLRDSDLESETLLWKAKFFKHCISSSNFISFNSYGN